MSYLAAASTFTNALTKYYFPDNENIVDMLTLRRQIHNDETVNMDVNHLFQAAIYEPTLILRHRSMFQDDVRNVALIELFLQSPGDFATFVKCEDIPVLRNPQTLYSMADVIGVSRKDCDTIRYEIIGLTQNLKQHK